MSSRVFGIVNGAGWGGMDGGRGGSSCGAGKVGRGASRRGSTCLRYVVKTSGVSRGWSKGTSRLLGCQYEVRREGPIYGMEAPLFGSVGFQGTKGPFQNKKGECTYSSI